MSQWHRENPELIGSDADPWMQHESYRRSLPPFESYCPHCHAGDVGIDGDYCGSCGGALDA